MCNSAIPFKVSFSKSLKKSQDNAQQSRLLTLRFCRLFPDGSLTIRANRKQLRDAKPQAHIGSSPGSWVTESNEE